MVTTPYYYGVCDSFRSELDEMVLIHNFIPGKINPGLNSPQDNLMYRNMCPDPDTEIPLVIQSPAGSKGCTTVSTLLQASKVCLTKKRKKY